jgi:uncharacterized membrane protein
VSRGTSRLVGFSVGVFAITITLLILEIKPPDDENLLRGLVDLWPSYLAYALTFLFIGQVWLTTALPVLGVLVIAAFNAYYWLPIPGETPRRY